jgi:hypothetical protein
MLHSELQIVKTTTPKVLEECELIPNIGKHLGIIGEPFFIGDHEPR